MKYITNIALGLLAVTATYIVVACGSGAAQDPAEQIAALKAQKAEIEAQIVTLEKSIPASQREKKVRLVGLTEIKPAPFKHFIDLQGKVDADQSVTVSARVPGALSRVLIKNGDNVRKGQLLAEVDDAIMQKSMAELEGQLVTATDVFNRQKGLWDQRIGTEIAFIQAKNAKESIERSMATLRESIGMYKIYAPQSGTVDMVMLKQGQLIAPGAPLCNILNLSNLKVKGEVTEAYAAKVRKGDRVQVFFPDLNKEISTVVTYVSKAINPMTRTFVVECALQNAGEYRANMVAVMKIVDYQNANAISIPVNMVQTAEDGSFVLIAEKTGDKTATAKKVSIKQGQNYNGQVEILNGLQKGDWIISTGYQDVNAGEAVAF
jgi:membrane fusion protein, multidrug efflux system